MYQEACYEFMRTRSHIPYWNEEFTGMRNFLDNCPWTHFSREEEEFFAKITLESWIRMMKKESPAQLLLAQMMGTAAAKPYYFVTVNYPKEFENWEYMNSLVDTLGKQAWAGKVDHVHEFHGSDGNHPHTHFLITATRKLIPSEIIDKVYALKGLKKHIGGKNFIHLAKNRDKTIEDYTAYIVGAKTDTKLENVTKDILWRQENNLT